jgi:hypothetical protein
MIAWRIVFASAVALACAAANDVSFIQDAVTEADALADLDSHLKTLSKSEAPFDRDTGNAVLSAAMHRGWFTLARKLVELSTTSNVDLSTSVHQTGALVDSPNSIRPSDGCFGDVLLWRAFELLCILMCRRQNPRTAAKPDGLPAPDTCQRRNHTRVRVGAVARQYFHKPQIRT